MVFKITVSLKQRPVDQGKLQNERNGYRKPSIRHLHWLRVYFLDRSVYIRTILLWSGLNVYYQNTNVTYKVRNQTSNAVPTRWSSTALFARYPLLSHYELQNYENPMKMSLKPRKAFFRALNTDISFSWPIFQAMNFLWKVDNGFHGSWNCHEISGTIRFPMKIPLKSFENPVNLPWINSRIFMGF